jgi:predicted PurR-regulated permease PerM
MNKALELIKLEECIDDDYDYNSFEDFFNVFSKKKNSNKKGQVTLYILLMVLILFVVGLSAMMFPFLANLSTELYIAGEGILEQTNRTVQQIQDPTIRAQIMENVETAQASQQDNITVFTGLYKYGWVIALIVITLFLFLVSRRLVEGGFFI